MGLNVLGLLAHDADSNPYPGAMPSPQHWWPFSHLGRQGTPSSHGRWATEPAAVPAAEALRRLLGPEDLGFRADHATRVLKSTRLEDDNDDDNDDDVPSDSEKLNMLGDRSEAHSAYTRSLSGSTMEISMFSFFGCGFFGVFSLCGVSPVLSNLLPEFEKLPYRLDSGGS